MKHFSNVFQISGVNGSASFFAETEESKNEYEKLVNNIIKELKKKKHNKVKMGTNIMTPNDILVSKTFLNLSINVLGSEQRNCEGFSKHTIYIIEITLNNFLQRIFFR